MFISHSFVDLMADKNYKAANQTIVFVLCTTERKKREQKASKSITYDIETNKLFIQIQFNSLNV